MTDAGAPLLVIDGLRVRRGAREVLAQVDLQIEAGDWLALLGPNGSGKSTLLAAIAGRLTPAAGHIVVAGADLRAARSDALASLGYAVAPQDLPARLTALQCLELTAAARGTQMPDEALWRLADRLRMPDPGVQVGRLSLGTRQKLAALMSLVGDPPLLLLDETLAGLDLRAQRVLLDELDLRRRAGAAIIVASHDLHLVAARASRMLLLVDGRPAAALSGRAFARARNAPLGDYLTTLLEDS